MISFDKVVKTCTNCGHDTFSPFGEREHLGYHLNYIICNNCTLIVQQHQMTDERLDEFYQNDYRRLYSDMQQPSAALLNTQKKRGQHLASFFAEVSGYTKTDAFNYIDIGCSTGVHLDAVKQHFPNATAYGIEPGKDFRNFCQQKGLSVFKSLDELISAGVKVDAICLSHVLEHIPDPANYLKYLNENIATENCLLLIEVPNTLGGHLSFELAHPVCFYDKTLINTCQLAGFQNIAIKEHNVTSNYPEPQYLTGLFRKTNQPISTIDYTLLDRSNIIKKRQETLIRTNTKSIVFKLKRKVSKLFR